MITNRLEMSRANFQNVMHFKDTSSNGQYAV
jgi:hypothetical protein